MLKIILLSLLVTSIYAYEQESKLKVLIIGKVAKYISWQKTDQDRFIITILKNNDGDLFQNIYKNRKIKHKPVVIKYIDNINQLQDTDILYISPLNNQQIPYILKKLQTENNIFTISDIRGFAEKGGMMQIYFASQRAKIKINLTQTTDKKFKIKSSLLRIADVLRGSSLYE